MKKKVGYIPQDHLITSDKISKNIALETDEDLINKEKLYEAISSANLNNLISKLKYGVNTYIGKDELDFLVVNIKN